MRIRELALRALITVAVVLLLVLVLSLVGYDWAWRKLLVRPFAAVRNWSNVEYDGQLRPNAAFGRAFEPAPEAELLAGVEVRWGGRP